MGESTNARRWLAPGAETRVLGILTVLLVGLSAALASIGRPLVTAEAPQGIVSFELAGSNDAALRMVASWDADAREAAHLSLGLDYLYLVVYPAWLSLVCWMLARRLDGPIAGAGRRVGRAVWLAAPLDALENAALLRLMEPDPGSTLALLATVCAALKFALVATAVAYLLTGGFARLVTGGSGARWRR